MPEIRLTGGDLDGLDIHYVEAGHGPVTVLIHGLGGFAETWRRTAGPLARGGRVIALDLPGFGASSKPRRDYRLAFLARSVCGLLDRFGIDRVRLAGHSLGGAVAVACAALFPDRVQRLALLGACIPGFAFHPSLPLRLVALPGIGEVLSRLVTPGLCRASVARCLVRPDSEEVDFFVSHRYAERSGPAARAAYLATVRAIGRDLTTDAPAWRRAVDRIDHPVLIVHGRQDPVIAVAHAAAAAAGLSRAETCLLDDCGHFPQIEHAPLVTDRLADFLQAPSAR
jgi:pimeloyl-ACP methyl ester carboxylesterase